MTSRRSWIAAALTIVAPGMGQLYLGLPVRAVVMWIAALALTAIGIYGILTPAFTPLVAWLLLLAAVGFKVWVGWDAFRRARTAPPATAWYQRWYMFVLIALAIGAAVEPFIRTRKGLILQGFRLPSGSSEPTLLVGDYVFSDMRVSARVNVPRGALVVFSSIEEPGLKVLKRVVALGGDTVAMRQGTLLVNGAPVEEPYVKPLATLHGAEPDQRAAMLKWQEPLLIQPDSVSLHPDLNDWGPLVLPRETLFLLGDNRQASYDSRFWGPLPQRKVLGGPRMIYYSFDPSGWLPLPHLTAIRWSRLGTHPK